MCVLELLRAFKRRDGVLYVANGVLLWLGFLLTRVISLLWCAVTHISDLMVLHSEDGLCKFNTVLLFLTLPSLLFIWALSTFWFTKIHRGMLKALKDR